VPDVIAVLGVLLHRGEKNLQLLVIGFYFFALIYWERYDMIKFNKNNHRLFLSCSFNLNLKLFGGRFNQSKFQIPTKFLAALVIQFLPTLKLLVMK